MNVGVVPQPQQPPPQQAWHGLDMTLMKSASNCLISEHGFLKICANQTQENNFHHCNAHTDHSHLSRILYLPIPADKCPL
jgi:hypothetical protein